MSLWYCLSVIELSNSIHVYYIFIVDLTSRPTESNSLSLTFSLQLTKIKTVLNVLTVGLLSFDLHCSHGKEGRKEGRKEEDRRRTARGQQGEKEVEQQQQQQQHHEQQDEKLTDRSK